MSLLAGLGPLGVPELLIIAFIIVLIFGVGRLPEVGGAVGRGIREFRKASRDDGSETRADMTSATASDGSASTPAAAASEGRFCTNCGARNSRDAKFCAECGTPTGIAVS
jgi:sec-independent protein translocase protein TatA